jgi:hypothetical protein
MSDNIWRVEALALNGLQFPGVSSMIVCDCGKCIFKIGTEVDLVGNKYIRYVECADCGKQTRTQQIQVQFPGVSNMMICDCGSHTFKIGIEVDLVGNKYIRCVECADCGKQTAVLLRSAEVRPAVVR